MSWKKYFRTANVSGVASPINGAQPGNMGFKNYQSNLPEVYTGHPNRIERYNQYEQMDMDSEINAALDILAEFSTQASDENGSPFQFFWREKPTDNEVKIIKEQLTQWCTLNELNERTFKIFRNTIKYGDQVFLRDPETFKLFWVEMSKVTKIIVNEAEGKKPEQYIVKDIGPNFQNLTATTINATDISVNHPQVGGPAGAYIQPKTPYSGGSRFSQAQNESTINAEHIVHISLTEGLDFSWPFGNSVLENVFKVFKQKELLEDAILIYRIQRAPERRMFKIDVGNLPSHMAMAFVERVKNEISQRRIPTQTGGGQNMMDATYNPLSTNEDYFFPVTAEGRGSSVEILQGGQNLGEITDLHFFTNKLFRGLRIRASYLPTGMDTGLDGNNWNDGKVGNSLIQEWRFNQYCMRLQKMVVQKLDQEFKMFMRWRGINIDGAIFELRFNEPQNFASYRQAELDTTRINSFAQMEQIPYMSKRFMLSRFLGLTEEEMKENERMWREEQGDIEEAPAPEAGLRSVGITPGAIGSDLGTLGPTPGTEAPGATPGVVPGAGAAPAGGAPGAGTAPPPI